MKRSASGITGGINSGRRDRRAGRRGKNPRGRTGLAGSRILRIGELGQRSPVPSRSAEVFGSREVRAERVNWQRRYGRAWTVGLESVARWADQVGIPLRAGSSALASSKMAREWGWSWGWSGGGLPRGTVSGHQEERPSRPTWVLRTAPGWVERVREQIDRDGRLSAAGPCPHLVVEETHLAFLPAEPLSVVWPGREAWLRAGRLLDVGGEEPLLPSDLEDLFVQLRQGALGRHPLDAERAWITTWDLWCAASAWEHDRVSWWLVRAGRGFVSGREELQWQRRAVDWGMRILPPSVARSRVCAAREGHAVRLGLDGMSTSVRVVAPGLVLERVRGGSFDTVGDFVRRGRRCRVGWTEIADLAVGGALRELPGASTALIAHMMHGMRPVVQRVSQLFAGVRVRPA